MIPLSDGTIALLDAVIDAESRNRIAVRILNEISENIPFCENSNPGDMERLRFSVLRLLAEGQMAEDDIFWLAKNDWRDLLMASGHGSTEEHRKWASSAIRHAAQHGSTGILTDAGDP